MSEDEINQIKKATEKIEKDYIEFQGMMKVIRAVKLNNIQQSIVMILEKMVEGFTAIGYHLCDIDVKQIYLSRDIEKTQKEIRQLKETLDTLEENR